MKKVIALLLLLLVPIGVFASTNNETIIEVIEKIENVIVDEDIIINSVKVNEKEIILNMLEEGKNFKRKVNYQEDKGIVSFSSGVMTMPIDNTMRDNTIIENNEYAFYIYSIIENRTNTPYEEDNYYNLDNIKKMALSISEEDINNQSIDYYDSTHTFGLSLKVLNKDNDNIKYEIVYHCFLDSNYQVNSEDVLTNPHTGNYSLHITLMLLAVLGIGAYTIYTPKRSDNHE